MSTRSHPIRTYGKSPVGVEANQNSMIELLPLQEEADRVIEGEAIVLVEEKVILISCPSGLNKQQHPVPLALKLQRCHQ